ncbi:Sodium/calcium exchanger protein-domain-containing protein [Spinellus fusiger]|nr:Sodium/calcium exchanger protein-domain-containing protein [Spinellus fusiger]
MNIESHLHQCEYVKKACQGYSQVFLQFYYCSTLWKPVLVLIMCCGLLLLFGAVSVASADFFCPNLQFISTKLQLSESLAGVTILAFGNGSPDLFSTFSAMGVGSGSLAIGELIGAAFFIVSVVSGCMGIIHPFTSKRVTFMRDATFLTGAIIIIAYIIYNQKIEWYHGVFLISYYVVYVCVVMSSLYWGKNPYQTVLKQDCPCEESLLIGNKSDSVHYGSDKKNKKVKPPKLHIPDHGFHDSTNTTDQEPPLGSIIRPVSPLMNSRSPNHIRSRPLSSRSISSDSLSIHSSKRTMTPRVGMRPSVFNAIDFHEQVSNILKANSSTTLNRNSYSDEVYDDMSTQRRPKLYIQSPSSPPSSQLKISQHRQQPHSSEFINIFQDPNDYSSQKSSLTPFPSSSRIDMKSYMSSPGSQHNISIIPEIRLDPPNLQDDSPPSMYKDIISKSSPSQLPLSQSSFLNITPALERSLSSASLNADWIPFHATLPNASKTNEKLSILNSLYSIFSLRNTFFIHQEIREMLFPTLQYWSEKTIFAKISAIFAVPIVLLFTLTLPVAECEEIVKEIPISSACSIQNDVKDSDRTSMVYLAVPHLDEMYDSSFELNCTKSQQPRWCKWLLVLQTINSSVFVTVIMAGNGWFPFANVIYGVGVGCSISLMIYIYAPSAHPPTWYPYISFAGFIIALHWVFILANTMVGLLQAIGIIFHLSDAIMGLTIFALGNSLGDLVTNTAIAEMGLPTMAISACYAGPLLNMVLGVGISSTYQIWKTGQAYPLEVSPTILISAAGLVLVLVSTIVITSLNGYRIDVKLGWWLIFVYSTCCLTGILIEFRVFG